MKKVLFSVVSLIVAVSSANLVPDMTPRMETPKDPKKAEIMMKRFGGYVNTKMPGKVLVLADARQSGSSFVEVAEEVQRSSEIPCEYRKIEKSADAFPVKAAMAVVADKNVGAAVYVFDGEKDFPVLTVMPEKKIALLNSTPLKDGADEKKFSERIRKELWRAASYVAGGANSGNPYCVMKNVFDVSDLDSLESLMSCPIVTGRMRDSIPDFGFGRFRRMTYREACRVGCAPAPVNEYQKRIAERVAKEKAEALKEPTKPIKIKFDPKKGR